MTPDHFCEKYDLTEREPDMTNQRKIYRERFEVRTADGRLTEAGWNYWTLIDGVKSPLLSWWAEKNLTAGKYVLVQA